MRIIGVELRARVYTQSNGGEDREIAIIPCDVVVELPLEQLTHGTFTMNGTLHTDQGDIAIQDFPVNSNFFAPTYGHLRFKQTR